MATISDVARAAGVPVATVSHVINETRPVRPDTRRKVLAAVDGLAYRRDGVARSLRRAKTGTIGVMIADISNSFFADLVLGIEAAVHGADDPHTPILCNTEESATKERLYLDLLQEKRVDGIIMAPVGGSGPAVRQLVGPGLPIVCVDRAIEGLACDAVVLTIGRRRTGRCATCSPRGTARSRCFGPHSGPTPWRAAPPDGATRCAKRARQSAPT